MRENETRHYAFPRPYGRRINVEPLDNKIPRTSDPRTHEYGEAYQTPQGSRASAAQKTEKTLTDLLGSDSKGVLAKSRRDERGLEHSGKAGAR